MRTRKIKIEVPQKLQLSAPTHTLRVPPSHDAWQPIHEAKDYKDDPERLRAEQIASVFARSYNEDTAEKNTAADRLAMQAYDQMLLIFAGYIRAKASELSSTLPNAYHVKQDLIGIGRTTLLDSMKRWHPCQNRRFSRGNVDRNIKSAMYQWLNHKERIVDLPSKVLKDMFRYNAAKAAGGAEQISEVIKGWTKNHLEAVEKYAPHVHPHNNRDYIITEGKGENSYYPTHHAILESSPALRGTTDSVYSAICEPPPQSHDVRDILEEELRKLPHDEEAAVRSKFLLGKEGQNDAEGGATLREIGRRHHVTGESVRQRIARGLKKLRPRLAKRGIDKSVFF